MVDVLLSAISFNIWRPAVAYFLELKTFKIIILLFGKYLQS
jgi:hypothetical protein